jgi:hypothetical protein
MEREVMETVLQEMLQELKDQKAQLTALHTGLEGQNRMMEGMAGQYARSANNDLPVTLSDEQLLHLKELVEQQFEALRLELMKRPVTSYSVRHFSLLPPSFRMEHFPLLVNTIMKWVIALISLVFTMWLISGMVNR